MMNPFGFKIIEKCFQDASQHSGDDADFYLEENDWNDYQFYVLYYLHATKRITGTKNMLLGYLRIYNPQNEMFARFQTKSIFPQNEKSA